MCVLVRVRVCARVGCEYCGTVVYMKTTCSQRQFLHRHVGQKGRRQLRICPIDSLELSEKIEY